MQNRIKEIRKFFKETQQSFGEKLNVSKSTIEAIEYGRRDATDRIVSDICRVFEVNEEWLRTGAGEMLAPRTREKEIADLAKQMLYADESDFKSSLIEMIAGMPPEMIEYLKNWTLEYAEKVKKELPN